MDSGSPRHLTVDRPPVRPIPIADWTDQYFLRTKATVAHFGDVKVTYAVFMRRPVVRRHAWRWTG